MNRRKDTAYCRLCAKLKHYNILIYLQTGEEMCQKVVANLSRFNIAMDFQQNILPKTVCLPCVRSLERAIEFVTAVAQAQAFLQVQINTAAFDFCNENMFYEPPEKNTGVIDMTDERSVNSVETNDDSTNLDKVYDSEVMSDASYDLYYDYSVIHTNTEEIDIKPPNDIIEIKDESDEDPNLYQVQYNKKFLKDMLENKQNNNCKRIPLHNTVYCEDNINKQNNSNVNTKNKGKCVEQLQTKHKECNSEEIPHKVLATTVNTESTIKETQNARNDTQKNSIMVTNVEHIMQLTWKDYEWKCSHCEKLFPNIEELRKHSMQFHKSCNAYQCTDCRCIKFNLNDFLSHVRSHRHYLNYSCYKCFKKFPTAKHAMFHKKRVHECSDHVCSGCHYNFKSSEELKEHDDKYYSKRKCSNSKTCPNVCGICGKSFIKQSHLRNHVDVEHGEEKKLHHHGQGKKLHHCDICEANFKEPRKLALHKLTHTDIKPFTCDTCGKSFRTKAHLVTHMLTHTNFRAYSCTVCNKRFRLSFHLKLHMRQHTGEKPYSCAICQRQFTNICNRNKHVRNVHGIEMVKRRQTNKIQNTAPNVTSPDPADCDKS